ncbi:MAG: LysM peptidoglycan-binding domain-containing protein [Muribaculaceae bacterium]|nr:LysM peptidoglycan-binding domain-containing protein [Muribaculaceae bacterium]
MLQVQGMSKAAAAAPQKRTNTKNSNVITVKRGENLTVIAKRYGMNYKEFMEWTGLNSTFLKTGQKITLPTDTMPAGKGLSYLASKHNMSLNEFCKLNGIKNPNTYVPKKGEAFIVRDKKNRPASNPTTQNTQATGSTSVAAPTGGSSNINTNPKSKVVVKGKTFTAAELRNQSVAGGKADVKNRFKQYCKEHGIKYNENLLDTSPVDKYPLPTVDGKGNIVATETVLKPTGKPNGKTVILNAGHGGYNSSNGAFDVGTYTFVKKGGKYVPQFEYEVAANYANDAAKKYRAEGYQVILVSGSVKTVQHAVSRYDKKYGKNATLYSYHFKSTEERSGTTVLHNAGKDSNDRPLKTNLCSTLGAGESVRNDLAVLNNSLNMPSVLIEIDTIDGQLACSSSERSRFNNRIVDVNDRLYA